MYKRQIKLNKDEQKQKRIARNLVKLKIKFIMDENEKLFSLVLKSIKDEDVTIEQWFSKGQTIYPGVDEIFLGVDRKIGVDRGRQIEFRQSKFEQTIKYLKKFFYIYILTCAF